jgi:hypothetical protein
VRRLAPIVLCVALALSVGLTACSGDEDPDTTAGAAGAFGGADDCSQLVEETIAARTRVLDELGDAGRDDTERIDAALTAFGGDGPDLAVRYEGLGCDQAFDDAVCAAAEGLEGAGPAARDLVATWAESCALSG